MRINESNPLAKERMSFDHAAYFARLSDNHLEKAIKFREKCRAVFQ